MSQKKRKAEAAHAVTVNPFIVAMDSLRGEIIKKQRKIDEEWETVEELRNFLSDEQKRRIVKRYVDFEDVSENSVFDRILMASKPSRNSFSMIEERVISDIEKKWPNSGKIARQLLETNSCLIPMNLFVEHRNDVVWIETMTNLHGMRSEALDIYNSSDLC